jgi:SAM-dependent methyltransferase
MFTRHDWEGSPLCGQTSGPRYIARSAAIRKVLRDVHCEQALDIGCGSGNITRHLADFARHVHVTDLSDKAVTVAQETLGGAEAFTFEAIDVFACGPETRAHLIGRFDLVMLSEVLEHLDDDERALAVLNDLLSANGRLLLTVPADPSQWSVEDELAGHKRRYTKAELTHKLSRAGFRQERMINWGFPFTRALLGVERRLMGSRSANSLSDSPIQVLLKPARIAFKLNGIMEPVLSPLNLGIGYVVLAKKVRPANQD